MSITAPHVESSIRVLGPEGLARELASVVVHQSAEAGADASPSLVILVDPSPVHWEAAVAAATPIVLVSGRPLGASEAAEAVLRGADAVVDADAGLERLRHAVRVLLDGGTLLDPHQTRALVLAARNRSSSADVRLTDRERQILASIERGDTAKQTAMSLGISAKTVESLQGRLFCKLGVHSRVQAVARAHVLGLVK
ncbi:MAG: helix-turn-helix transcriptional regulator [Actinomycetota bacterium]